MKNPAVTAYQRGFGTSLSARYGRLRSSTAYRSILARAPGGPSAIAARDAGNRRELLSCSMNCFCDRVGVRRGEADARREHVAVGTRDPLLSFVTLLIMSPLATSRPQHSAISNTTSARLIFPILKLDAPRFSSFSTSLMSARDA